jgi:hypothetical protein
MAAKQEAGMHIERMKAVLANVKANQRFAFAKPLHECGSPACVMGSVWAVMSESLNLETNIKEWNLGLHIPSWASSKIADWLEISQQEFYHIYFGTFIHDDTEDDHDQEVCIHYLQRCIKLGHVDMELRL